MVVVADAVLNLGGKFCRDRFTRGVALATAVVLWLFPGVGVQLLALLRSLALTPDPPCRAGSVAVRWSRQQRWRSSGVPIGVGGGGEIEREATVMAQPCWSTSEEAVLL